MGEESSLQCDLTSGIFSNIVKMRDVCSHRDAFSSTDDLEICTVSWKYVRDALQKKEGILILIACGHLQGARKLALCAGDDVIVRTNSQLRTLPQGWTSTPC